MNLKPDEGIIVKKEKIKLGKRRIPILILQPEHQEAKAPGILWIHGGGYMLGMKEMVYISRAQDLVTKYGAVVISPGYRLSFLKPYPAAFDDCYEALKYMKDNAKRLGINDKQLMVGGESAGGGLCAAIVMKARDTKDVNIAFQMPLYPMIDNFDTETSKNNKNKIWNTKLNHIGWKLYLRKRAKKDVEPYAAPARQQNYKDLPPAYTFVATDEPFYAETIDFFNKMKNAGVEVELDVYEGLYHAFDMMEPKAEESLLAAKRFNEAFEYAKEHYYAEQTH